METPDSHTDRPKEIPEEYQRAVIIIEDAIERARRLEIYEQSTQGADLQILANGIALYLEFLRREIYRSLYPDIEERVRHLCNRLAPLPKKFHPDDGPEFIDHVFEVHPLYSESDYASRIFVSDLLMNIPRIAEQWGIGKFELIEFEPSYIHLNRQEEIVEAFFHLPLDDEKRNLFLSLYQDQIEDATDIDIETMTWIDEEDHEGEEIPSLDYLFVNYSLPTREFVRDNNVVATSYLEQTLVNQDGEDIAYLASYYWDPIKRTFVRENEE